jgi:hypothetical protein
MQKLLANISLPLLVITMWGLLFQSEASGQNAFMQQMKTLQFKSDTIIDTTDYHFDSILFYVPRYRMQQSKSFYDSLEVQAEQNQFSRLALQLLLSSGSSNNNQPVPAKPDRYFRHNGKIINKISIIQLDPFGTSLYDTSMHNPSKLERIGNTIHIKTLESVLENNLFLQEGDTLDISLLEDNERYLRQLEYLKDVNILVQNVFGVKNKVNVYFITRDIFSIGFFLNLENQSKGEVELFDKNFLGTGHRVTLGIPYENARLGLKTSYSINNIYGSFIQGQLAYENAFDNKKFLLGFKRDFFSYRTQYAGGFHFSLNDEHKTITKPDTVLEQVHLDYLTHDIWGARSFLLDKNSSGKRTRLILALRGKRDIFFDGPEITERYNAKYHDNSLLLTSIALSKEKFYKTRFMYSFGVTEDIPVGTLIKLTGGMERDEFYKRHYFAMQGGFGQFFPDIGFLHSHIDFGTYFYKKKAEQGTLSARLEYISKLFRTNNKLIRQFVSLNYLDGFNRFPDEYIELSNETDIRGINLDKQFGQRKLSLNSETVIFSDWFYYGFRFASYIFTDIGFISRKDQQLFANNPYAGIGFGFRIRNENLVFKTFQVRLALYPFTSEVNSPFGFRITGAKTYKATDYYRPGRPEIIPYK